jgi:hypothetical protein
MRKQQKKQLRLIAAPLAQAALRLGALPQHLIAVRRLDFFFDWGSFGLVSECGGT